MYIFELIAKIIKKHQNKPMKEFEESQNQDCCDHIFLPVDSTADYLACNKCGFLIKNKNKKI